MRLNRTCKICGDPFKAIKVTQFFCKRKCFKRDYYLRTKARIMEVKANPSYPIKRCGFCQIQSRLSFDPMESPNLFNAWACPHCGCTNKLVWEYQDRSNSYQLISQILISVQSQTLNSEVPSPVYQTYHLPVTRPEQGNPTVVVMTCETLNISDIQKKDRKKILFS